MEAMPTGCANSLETGAGAYEWFAADGALKAVQLVHVRLLYNGPPSWCGTATCIEMAMRAKEAKESLPR